jgi:hypothetical protein
MKILIPKHLWALPNTSWRGLCDLLEIHVWHERILFLSIYALEHLSFVKLIFVAFVTLRGKTSYMAQCHPRAPNLVVSLGKVCKGPLCPCKERSKILVEWEKWLKETQLRVDIDEQFKLPQRKRRNIGVGDFELWQTKQITVSILWFASLWLCSITRSWIY